MSDMRFNYTAMSNVSTKITGEITQAYITAGNKLVDDFVTAVSGWEGESKEKFEALIQGAVKEYLTVSIPKALEALAKLLDENAKQMHDADIQIAEQIPSTLG